MINAARLLHACPVCCFVLLLSSSFTTTSLTNDVVDNDGQLIILASHNGSYLYFTFKRKTSEEHFDNGNGKISESSMLRFCYRCMFVFVMDSLFAVVVGRSLPFASHNGFSISSFFYSVIMAGYDDDDEAGRLHYFCYCCCCWFFASTIASTITC